MVIISVRGGSGFGSGGRFESLNYQTPYLSAIFGFIGVTDISLIEVEHDESGGQPLADSMAAARMQMAQLVGESSSRVQ